MPELERERFIADTLYKKLWIHDYLPCPYRTWLFVVIILLVAIEWQRSSLKKVRDAFYEGVFLCLAEATRKV